ncbi:MAG: peptidoglycan glycosyltransferase [Lachnospiraceae bacterium]|nr:peptidoglycan glycosyltransferase [Lachnospiraceae bacterium]
MVDGKHKTFVRKKILFVFLCCAGLLGALLGRLLYLMVYEAEHYSNLATDLHERERSIKAARGRILDTNGVVIADSKTVCSISVIHNQIEDAEEVIRVLSDELDLSEEYVRKRVEKYSSIEKIKSNVDKEIGDRIRTYELAGVKVDEDSKRYYPYGELASKVLGFTGSDNQGIIGLEVVYDEFLAGKSGTILTVTDAKGIEIEEAGERRIEPVAGLDLQLTIDINIQQYATQLAYQAMEAKQAEGVSIIVMKPDSGEILAMVDVPEFDLNEPYEISEEVKQSNPEADDQTLLNQIWRNGCISDTYEPGSTFKMVTAATALENDVVSKESSFYCPGYVMVEDRRIRCHKVAGHGSQDFVHATMNSCNPVFVTVGSKIGVDRFYESFEKLGLLSKTGVDLPGEATTIMHKKENVEAVELATISFGQSFQITPIQLITTAAEIVNGGNRVTPHFGKLVWDAQTGQSTALQFPVSEGVLSEETSAQMREILEMVVSEGGGKNAKIEGVRIGGKTATSETLPRGRGVYIASFVGFAPADDPQVIALVIINHPQGQYYGGTIAAPVIKKLFENILPYLGVIDYNEINSENQLEE